MQYDRVNEDEGWMVVGASTQDGFGLGIAEGSMLWNEDREYQIRGTFQLEWKINTTLFRVVGVGTEIDYGPEHTVRVYLPSGKACEGWRRSKKTLVSSNTERRGTGYVLNFTPEDEKSLRRIQFVFSARYLHFEKALDAAYEKNCLLN